MQGKSVYTILISIIAVLSLALAVLIVILLTMNTDAAKQSGTDERVIPLEEQVEYRLYGDDSKEAIFNIKSTDKHPNSFIMASVSIVFDAGHKSSLLEERQTLIGTKYLSELKQATIEYFRGKTFEELQAEEGMQKARDDLKDIYNKIVGNGTDKKIIIKVIFDKWIIQ